MGAEYSKQHRERLKELHETECSGQLKPKLRSASVSGGRSLVSVSCRVGGARISAKIHAMHARRLRQATHMNASFEFFMSSKGAE